MPQIGPRLEVKTDRGVDEVEALILWLTEHLDPDPHARDPRTALIQVTSLYFDDPRRSCYANRSPRKLPKHRLRQYDGGGALFLEEKLRVGDRVWKRRLPLAEDEVRAVVEGRQRLAGAHEWFRSRFRIQNLAPALLVSYDRQAFVTPCGGRVPVDRNVRAARVAPRYEGLVGAGPAQVVTDHVVVEVKSPKDMSPLMKEVSETVVRRVRPCSKYSLGLEATGLESPPTSPGAE